MAKELLDTPDADLEANCRKLKSRCRSELEYVASEGKFDMQNPVLYGIVSTMAELLKGDTQLVESINSIIRLVGERCPSIDLQTMSARIVVKKAAKGELGEAGAAAKRWSNVLKLAKPLLLELTAAGTTFQSILREEGRFAQPTRTSMACLDDALRNTDITKALPDLKQDLKKAVDAARRESKRLQATLSGRRQAVVLRNYTKLLSTWIGIAGHQLTKLVIILFQRRSSLVSSTQRERVD